MALASEAGAGSSDKNFGSLLRQLSTGGTVASGTDGASSPGTQAVRSPRGRHNPATLDLLTTGGNDNPAGRAAARRHFQKELAKTQDPLVTSRIKVILQRLGDMALLANRRRSQSAAAVGIPVGSGLKGIRESSAQHDRPDDAADSVASSALGGAGVGGGQPQRPGHAGHLELLYGLTTTELLLVELDASVSHLCDAFHQLPEDLRRLLCAKL